MPKVKVGDINIYYEVHGQGEPIVFMQGAGASTVALNWAIPVYSREFQMVLFDTRGIGQSDKPDIPYSMKMMASDLAGLLDSIGIDKVHIRGVSLGGMIAQHFALDYPKRVRSLILRCTTCGGTHISMFSAEVGKIQDMFLQETITAIEMGRKNLFLCYTKEYLERNPGVQQAIQAMKENPDPDHVSRRYIQAWREHDTYERLPEINIPTLVMAGDGDRLIPVENSRILAERILGSKLVIYKNAGHLLAEAGAEPIREEIVFFRQHKETLST